MKVFVLATCRQEALLPYTTLVFQTLRVGFPTAEVEVVLNGAIEGIFKGGPEVSDAASAAGCHVRSINSITHHEWIEQLILNKEEPFWICDTDMIFYAPVEFLCFEEPLAGALIPEFSDPFTKAITRSRLHTSLMKIRPSGLCREFARYREKHPETIYNPPANLVHPLYLPLNGRTYFYDTMAMAYHAVGGEAFSPTMMETYFHFHFSTFEDMVLPVMPERMKELRQAVLADHDLGRGLWREQLEWFGSRQFAEDGIDVIAPIDNEDAQEARKWNIELCKGDQNAMVFCDLWYRYCHGIDDLIDTLRDGRPRMSKDQMISLFWNAAILYNCDFFVRNRDLLSPIVLQVTNTYRDSVAWEHSSKKHLRLMGDVFRTCGNEMYVMVALLCGGEAHMRKMSMAIKERDFVLQHDGQGNPR